MVVTISSQVLPHGLSKTPTDWVGKGGEGALREEVTLVSGTHDRGRVDAFSYTFLIPLCLGKPPFDYGLHTAVSAICSSLRPCISFVTFSGQVEFAQPDPHDILWPDDVP